MSTRPFDGHTVLLDIDGGVTGGLTAADQRNLIVTSGIPLNPDNWAYMPVVNTSSFPSVAARGMRTPAVRIVSCMKPWSGSVGWADAKIFNSLMGVNSSTQNTDSFSIFFKDDTSTQRIWDVSRCDTLQFQWDAAGGPCMVTMGFKSRFGDAIAEAVYGKTFANGEVIGSQPTISAPSGADAGELSYDANIDFNNTISDTARFTLSLVRAQRWRPRAGCYVPTSAGSIQILYPAGIDSGMFSGILTVDQDPDAATAIEATNGTIRINFNTDKTSSTGRFNIVCKVNRDNKVYAQEPGFGNTSRTYSLIVLSGTGGNPSVCTAY